MTVAFVAEQLAAEYPDVYSEFSGFMQKKRLIGLVNTAMSEGQLAWIMHRGQRRITPEGLAAFLADQGDMLERMAEESRRLCAEPGRDKPIAERYPLSQPGKGKRRRRKPKREEVDMGPSLGEIE